MSSVMSKLLVWSLALVPVPGTCEDGNEGNTELEEGKLYVFSSDHLAAMQGEVSPDAYKDFRLATMPPEGVASEAFLFQPEKVPDATEREVLTRKLQTICPGCSIEWESGKVISTDIVFTSAGLPPGGEKPVKPRLCFDPETRRFKPCPPGEGVK